MSNRGLWLEGGTTFPDRTSRVLAVGLALAWAVLIGVRNTPAPPAGTHGCLSDPWDFLRIGETVELKSLALIVEAHCTDAKVAPGGWIELRWAGGRVDVEVRQLDIAGATYFQIVSIGGIPAPAVEPPPARPSS
jgi:hypothetical protein